MTKKDYEIKKNKIKLLGQKNFLLRWILILLVLFLTYLFFAGQVKLYMAKNIEKPRNGAVFVDQNSRSFFHNGSPERPFLTIGKAIEFVQQNPEFSNIFVRPGLYEESLILPRDINLAGQGENITIINPETGSEETITALGKSILSNLRIEGGRYGLFIPPQGKDVIINNCTITDARQWGIYSDEIEEENNEEEEGEKDDEEDKLDLEEIPQETTSTTLSIIKSQISNNDRQGAYLQKGFLYVNDSEFFQNGEEGVDLHVGMESFIKNSRIFENGEGGIETELGNVALVVENCVVEKNGASGINIQSFEKESIVLIKNNQIKENAGFGVRCAIHHKPFFSPYFSKMLTIEKDNRFEGNGRSAIDPACNL